MFTRLALMFLVLMTLLIVNRTNVSAQTGAVLSGAVYVDTDGDGKTDKKQLGATISLSKDGQPVEEKLTSIYGEYIFQPLDPGNYEVCASLPSDMFELMYDGDDMSDGCTEFVLSSNIDFEVVEFGFKKIEPPHGSIGGIVWYDDGDGVMENNEQRAEDIKVVLTDLKGVSISTWTTSEGRWGYSSNFAHVVSVQAEMPDGYYPTLWRQGSDPAADSDVSNWNGNIATLGSLSVVMGEENDDYGLGLVQDPCAVKGVGCPQPTEPANLIIEVTPEEQTVGISQTFSIRLYVTNDGPGMVSFNILSVYGIAGIDILAVEGIPGADENSAPEAFFVSNLQMGLPEGAAASLSIKAVVHNFGPQTINFCLAAEDEENREVGECGSAKVNNSPTNEQVTEQPKEGGYVYLPYLLDN